MLDWGGSPAPALRLGLGDLGIRYGYQRFMPSVMAAVVIILIVLVQLVQSLGEWLAAKVDKRAPKGRGQ